MTGPEDGFPPPWKVQASWNHPNPLRGQQRDQESSRGPGLGARRAETTPRLGVLGGSWDSPHWPVPFTKSGGDIFG